MDRIRSNGGGWTTLAALFLSAAGVLSACAADDEPTNKKGSEASGAEGGYGGSGGDATTTTSTSSTGGDEIPCPYTGAPLFDPTSLPACPAETCNGGAHCVPNSLVSPEQQAILGDCDPDNKCVPDPFIAAKGAYLAPTCTSFNGSEGRCVSTCVPSVAAQAAILPQDICGVNEVCAPCFDPFTAVETGACRMSCDAGPTTEGPVPLPECCNGNATCVPTGAIPDEDEAKLAQDSCPTDGDGMLCVPNEMLDPTWEPTVHCETSELLQWTYGEEYWEGGCLPSCLGAVQQPGLDQDVCPPHFKCAPCWDPENYGQLTGACPWKGSN
jgi:hypothetical protein